MRRGGGVQLGVQLNSWSACCLPQSVDRVEHANLNLVGVANAIDLSASFAAVRNGSAGSGKGYEGSGQDQKYARHWASRSSHGDLALSVPVAQVQTCRAQSADPRGGLICD